MSTRSRISKATERAGEMDMGRSNCNQQLETYSICVSYQGTTFCRAERSTEESRALALRAAIYGMAEESV